jgi:hypothetical protein
MRIASNAATATLRLLGSRPCATLRLERFSNMRDVQERLANRVQLTTDGNIVYLDAVLDYFAEIDFATLQKLYGPGEAGPEARYSSAKCNGTKKKVILGNPDPDHISTSYMER